MFFIYFLNLHTGTEIAQLALKSNLNCIEIQPLLLAIGEMSMCWKIEKKEVKNGQHSNM